MSAAASVKAVFGKKTLYEILGVDKHATPAAIKKAYFRLALKFHPDKNKDANATPTFQALGHVHAVLSDADKRKVYDETGVIDDDSEDGRAWKDYFRSTFPAVTVDAIEAYAKKYRMSEEERRDVLQAYVQSEGNMTAVIDNVVLCTLEDEARFRAMILAAVEAGEVPEYDRFAEPAVDSSLTAVDLSDMSDGEDDGDEDSVEEAEEAEEEEEEVKATPAAGAGGPGAKKRGRRAVDEAAEAEKMARKLGVPMGADSDAALVAMIRSKQQRDSASLIQQLEAKYGGGGASKTTKKAKAGAGKGRK